MSWPFISCANAPEKDVVAKASVIAAAAMIVVLDMRYPSVS
jgi:hypothetical protein